ncbi:MAG TPA: sodium:proton antiporter NhaD [Saprospiraceae bacterium]|nr:sodium:proton antiporter NhaD [Saprospiraceae bacterium]
MGLAIIVCIFILGYLLIATEHLVKLDKAASAILLGAILWVGVVVLKSSIVLPTGIEDATEALHSLFEGHVSEIASILFFLLGAMTVVEIIDAHEGFNVITDRIQARSRIKLLWLISIVTFFLSAILDNLTTAIVMTMLIKKLMSAKEDQWLMGSFVVIAANAGGAWSPIGDVTTIMLWIGGQISSFKIISAIFIESVVCLLVPLLLATFFMKNNEAIESVAPSDDEQHLSVSKSESRNVLLLGVGALLFIPFFKSMTHLPPFMGILFGLGVLWYYTDIIHRGKGEEIKNKYSISAIIRRVDTPSILFFLGILLAVAALQTLGILSSVANYLNENVGNIYVINIIIGLLSAIVDNVPLVAACIAMYPLETFGMDHNFWTFLAYCAGTGGSVLIIGSAAGVAIMGILKIDFIWYFKKISWLALAGYLAGAGLFVLLS